MTDLTIPITQVQENTERVIRKCFKREAEVLKLLHESKQREEKLRDGLEKVINRALTSSPSRLIEIATNALASCEYSEDAQ